MNDEPMNKIKSRLIVAILIILATHTYAELTPAMKIAKDKSIEGKYKEGKCAVFAMQLHYLFDQAKIPAYVIFEKWTTSDQRTGFHCFVVFQDGKDYLAIDNMMRKPVGVLGSAPVEWAMSFEDANGRGNNHIHVEDFIPPAYKLREEVK